MISHSNVECYTILHNPMVFPLLFFWFLWSSYKCRIIQFLSYWFLYFPPNTIEFIFQHDVPTERKKDVTYGQFVCTVRPEKAEPNRTRFTVEGDRINYPGEVATPTADMLVAKMLFNSAISTKGAYFMTKDISNFYLMTPLHDHPEFIRMKQVPYLMK